MPITITAVEPGSLADSLGWAAGDQVLAVNGESVADELDFRFKSTEESLTLRLRRKGSLIEVPVEKDPDEPFGIEIEEFRIKTCGDDCVFCFVDQNPLGLREALYFRDGDFRMSFLYGNYITVTNLRERDLQRIVEQRLSPMYISAHCTTNEIRSRMMGHRTQNDQLMEKLRFFHEHEIDMHAQIVLVPGEGYNDGGALLRTIYDLLPLRERLFSVSIVPVGLTSHRKRLTKLRAISRDEARQVIRQVHRWQAMFREWFGRGFVYASDEFYILAEMEFPQEDDYDGYPLMENGVGMSRDFLNELQFQSEELPASLPRKRRLTMATGTLAAPLLAERVAPLLARVANLEVDLVTCSNLLFGEAVTVSGLLNYRSLDAALRPLANEGRLGDLVLLPPDSVNFEGCFLDNVPGSNTPEDLAAALGRPVEVFGGDWVDLVDRLAA